MNYLAAAMCGALYLIKTQTKAHELLATIKINTKITKKGKKIEFTLVIGIQFISANTWNLNLIFIRDLPMVDI